MNRTFRLQRRCLTLISRFAARVAADPNPERCGDALLELFFYLRHGTRGRDLEWLHHELSEIDAEESLLPSDALDIMKI